MSESVCKGCGRKIVWGVTAEGKKIPLDPVPPVYQVFVEGGSVTRAERIERAYVSHFATCPKASQFSQRSKVKGGENNAKDS